jgi:hypothetical protein
MPSIAPISPAVQYEIDACFEALAADPTLWMPSLDPLVGMDLAGLFKGVKSWPQTSQRRSFNQRDITRLLRGAKTAGVEVRVMIEEGRITLVPTKPVLADADIDENPWEKFRRG